MSQQKHQIYFTQSDYKTLKKSYIFQLLRKFTDPQHLLVAKAYFIQQQYAKCIQILQNKITSTSNPKIVFQKYSLLFRATYLLNNYDDKKLQAILKRFQQQKSKHADYKFKSYHLNVFKQFGQFLKIQLKNHIEKQNQVVDENHITQNKLTQDVQTIQNQLKKAKSFNGFPCFILQKKWRSQQQKFMRDNYKPHPGPITNFSIVNHIYQILPYQNTSKNYLNTILFPNDNHQTINKKHWEHLQKTYSGIPVKRIQIKADQFVKTSQTYDETVTKIHIIGNGRSNIIQVCVSSLWFQVISILSKYISIGQLKQRISKNLYQLVDSNERVGLPTQLLKFIIISQHNVHSLELTDIIFRNQLFLKYDFQAYPMISLISQGLIGIQNPKFLCYMIASLQCLSNTPKLTANFLQNEHLQNINFSQKNINGSRGQITCAYADLIKKLWTFDKNQRDEKQINISSFKQAFGNRFDIFGQDTQQDAHQFLNFLLNCLHDDLNVKKNDSRLRNSLFKDTTGFLKIRDAYISLSEKNNQSIISKLFKSYTYSSLMCKQCNTVYYNFDVHLTITLPLPTINPAIGVRFISHTNIDQELEVFKIFVSKIRFVKELVEIIKKKKKVTSEEGLQYRVFAINRKSLVFFQQVSFDAEVESIISVSNQYYFVLYELKKISQSQLVASNIHTNVNVSTSNKGQKIVKCLVQFLYNSERKAIPRLITINVNASNEEKMKIASQFISDASISKISSNVLTDKQKQELIQTIKMQKTKNKPFDYTLKVILKKRLILAKQSQIQELGQQCADDQHFDIQTCFKIYNKKQSISVNQNWNCQKCAKICQAEKQQNIYEIGNNMIITLKRFKDDQKIYTKINYPINNLDMNSHVSQKSKSTVSQKFIYDLYGVIVHRGNLNRGHYTAYCKHYGTKKWYLYDDQDVRQVQDEEQIVNQNAYILFYERRK